MRNLLIIGARGYGREVYNLYLQSKVNYKELVCKGFLDDNKEALNGYKNYPPIISSPDEYNPEPNDVFICALGDPFWKRHFVSLIKKKGGEFISLIHPTAIIGINTTIGVGAIIESNVNISNDVFIGDFCTFGTKSGIGHDSKVGNFSHIGAHVNISGFVTIGTAVTLHPGSNILPHKKVGNEAIVGAGSVAIRNVKNNTTVFGIPAKII